MGRKSNNKAYRKGVTRASIERLRWGGKCGWEFAGKRPNVQYRVETTLVECSRGEINVLFGCYAKGGGRYAYGPKDGNKCPTFDGPKRYELSDALMQIREKEQARFAAMIAGDLSALSQLLDDELVYVHSSGKVDSKSEYLETLRSGSIAYESIEVIRDHHRHGEESFILVQSLSAKMRLAVGAEPVMRKLSIMSVWRETVSGWKLVAMHSAAIL
jgi:hypothetical protein